MQRAISLRPFSRDLDRRRARRGSSGPRTSLDAAEGEDDSRRSSSCRPAPSHVALDLVVAHQRHAEDEHRDAEVREQHAVPSRADLARRGAATPARRRRRAQPLDAGRSRPRRRSRTPAAGRAPPSDADAAHAASGDEQRRDDARRRAPTQARRAGRAARRCFQRASGPTPIRKTERRHQRHEHGVEVGRADRDLAEAERVEEQRIERAEQHRAAGDDAAARCCASSSDLARDRREARRRGRRFGARQAKSASEPPITIDQEGEDEDAARADRWRTRAPR